MKKMHDLSSSYVRMPAHYAMPCRVDRYQSVSAFMYPLPTSSQPIDMYRSSQIIFTTFLQFNPPITLKSCTTTRSTLVRSPLNSQFDSLDLEPTERELDLGFSLVVRL
jgi:hypothetical protein